jgi:zinc protease
VLTNTGNYFKNLTRAASALCLALVLTAATAAAQQAAPAPSQPAPQQSVAYSSAEASALVTEFDVNGLKVLVKRRAGSQTVVAGLFLRGGAQNVTAETAGIEALMLDAASEASRSYPRASLRKELARMGTGISYGVNYDYSAMTLGTTRYNFDRSWEIFTDVVLHPSFAPEDVERVRNRLVASLRDDNDVPDNYLQVLQARAAYAGHPYLNNPRGTPETMARFTVEDVRRYHAQAMQTSRLLLV